MMAWVTQFLKRDNDNAGTGIDAVSGPLDGIWYGGRLIVEITGPGGRR